MNPEAGYGACTRASTGYFMSHQND
jgi:hypothetical protein